MVSPRDGKTVTGDGKEVHDPKRVLAPVGEGGEGKGDPPPVGELVEVIDPGEHPNLPSTEFFPRDPRGIVDAPNRFNLAPPVVSPETPP